MAMPKLPIEGGCRCGRVRFRLTERPWLEAACHCRGCQRMTASAFSTTLVMPDGGFAVIAGQPVIGGMHGAKWYTRTWDRFEMERPTWAEWSKRRSPP